MTVDVSVTREAHGLLLVKLQAAQWEINVWAAQDDLVKLRDIRLADWNKRRSIRAGDSAGAPAFWAMGEDGSVSLLIGRDDETWDVAVSLPLEAVDVILHEIERDA